MTRTAIVTLGRLPKALDLIRALSVAGLRVVVAEPMGLNLCAVSRHVAKRVRTPKPSDGKTAYLRALAEAVAAEGAAIVCPVSEEVTHVAHLAPMVPGVRVFCPPARQVLDAHHKGRFAARARALGLTAPETFSWGSLNAAAMAANSDVVIKPAQSCAGQGVRFVDAGGAADDPDGAAGDIIVQRRVRGDAVSTFSVARAGRVMVTSIYRGTLSDGTVSVAFERIVQPAVEAWVEQWVSAEAWDGFVSFDFIVDGDGRPWAIECNPRMTSGVHFLRPEPLAEAILANAPLPARPEADWFRPDRRLQQFYPALTALQGRLFRKDAEGVRPASALFATRDVNWDPADPLPFIAMPVTALPIMLASARSGRRFGEVATADIGWFEAEQA